MQRWVQLRKERQVVHNEAVGLLRSRDRDAKRRRREREPRAGRTGMAKRLSYMAGVAAVLYMALTTGVAEVQAQGPAVPDAVSRAGRSTWAQGWG